MLIDFGSTKHNNCSLVLVLTFNIKQQQLNNILNTYKQLNCYICSTVLQDLFISNSTESRSVANLASGHTLHFDCHFYLNNDVSNIERRTS